MNAAIGKDYYKFELAVSSVLVLDALVNIHTPFILQYKNDRL